MPTTIGAWKDTLEGLKSSISSFAQTSHQLCVDLSSAGLDLELSEQVEKAYEYLDTSFETLDNLETELSRARRELGALRNHSLRLTPVNRLHPEILSQIFLAGQTRQEVDVLKSSAESIVSSPSIGINASSPFAFAMVVSQVCQRWREIALGTANLWTHIDFADEPPYCYSNLLLERSKRAPLSIDLSLSEADNRAGIDSVMDILVPAHSSRIASLGINAISMNQIDWILTKLIEGSDEPPPIADLQITNAEGEGEPVEISVNKNKLPELIRLTEGIKTLNLEGVQLPWRSPAFSNLTRLRLASNPHDPKEARPSELDFIHILQSSPLLESLVVCETGVQLERPEEPDHSLRHVSIKMAALRTLEIEEMSWNEIGFILHLITAPKLEGLRVLQPESRCDADGIQLEDNVITVDDMMYTAIFQFLTKISTPGAVESTTVSSPVQSLELESITNNPIGSERMTRILQAVPQLKDLSLIDICFDDDILNRMHGTWGLHSSEGPENRGVLCPELVWLKLTHLDHMTEDALYDLVSNRAKQGRRLRTLRLGDMSENENGMKPSSLKPKLQPFVETLVLADEGMVLSQA